MKKKKIVMVASMSAILIMSTFNIITNEEPNNFKNIDIQTVPSYRISDFNNSKEITDLVISNELQFISYIDVGGNVSRGIVNRSNINIDERICNYISANNSNLTEYDVVSIKDCIIKNSDIYNFDPLLIASIIKCESNFNTTIVSNMGAIGMMQLMPSTAEYIADSMGINHYNLNNYNDNIKIGTKCLHVYINSWDNITQIDYRTGGLYNKAQMGLMSYNGGVSNASQLKHIDYLHKVENEYHKLRYTNMYD